jgi:hypothetical protein
MKSVYKYDLEVTDKQVIKLPKFSDILSIQVQNGKPRLWVMIDKEETEIVDRVLYTYGTGHDIDEKDENPLFFHGTYQLDGGTLVFHVFEEVQYP